MNKQTKLEQIAIEQRASLLPKSVYNETDGNNYTVTHTRAKSDSETPIQGKGTGKYMDIDNGGGYIDENGNGIDNMSGRNANVAINDYNSGKNYETPDTSKNVGQIRF